VSSVAQCGRDECVAVDRLLVAQRRTRNDLEATTGASRATLGRILEDFAGRSWVRQEGSEYVATATGRLVASGFTDLLDITESERDLRPIVRYLLTYAMDFDLPSLAGRSRTLGRHLW